MMNKIFHIGVISGLLLLTACSNRELSTVDGKGQQVVEEQTELIREHIKDPEKQKRLLQIVSEIEQESNRFFSFYQDHNLKLSKVNRKYSAKRQDFEILFDDFNQKYISYLRTLLTKRSEMRNLITGDEWSHIMDRKSSFIPE